MMGQRGKFHKSGFGSKYAKSIIAQIDRSEPIDFEKNLAIWQVQLTAQLSRFSFKSRYIRSDNTVKILV
jgi:hypothetical protein